MSKDIRVRSLKAATLSVLGSATLASAANTITLAWDPSPDISVVSYTLYYQRVGSGAFVKAGKSTTCQKDFSGVIPGHVYLFKVTASDANGAESVPTDTIDYIDGGINLGTYKEPDYILNKPEDRTPPKLENIVNITPVPELTNYNVGENFFFCNYSIRLEGNAYDPNFIKSIKPIGDVAHISTNEFNPNGGQFTMSFIPKKIGTNLVDIVSRDFAGNYGTNQIIVYNFNGTGDYDADGLKDSDEIFTYKTNPKSPDSDGDGVSDFLEIKRGYNPLNPSDKFHPKIERLANGNNLLSFYGKAGQNYRILESTNSLPELKWKIAPGVTPTYDGLITLTRKNLGEPQKFFMIVPEYDFSQLSK